MLKVNKYSVSDFFFCVFLCLSGLGSYYNELYQIGGTLVIADIGLALFIMAAIYVEPTLSRKHRYLLICFFTMLIIGFIGGHSIGNILRDIKVFIYFFSAYLYCYKRKEEHLFISRISRVCIVMVMFTVVVCTIDFISNGLSNLNSRQILRTFGLGLSQTGLVAAFIILLACGDPVKYRLRKIPYYFLLVACFSLSILSYTRSVWLQLALSLLVYFGLNFLDNKNNYNVSMLLRLLCGIVAIIGGLVVLYINLNKHYPEIVNLFMARMNSIMLFGSGISYGGNADTLTDRLEELALFSSKYTNPLIVLGWGFGDQANNTPSPIIENSFVYYTWKYGIIWCAVLFYKLKSKFYDIRYRNDKINNAVYAVMIVYFIIGSMSGHLNKYYMLPYIAIFLLVDFNEYFSSNDRLSQSEMELPETEEY